MWLLIGVETVALCITFAKNAVHLGLFKLSHKVRVKIVIVAFLASWSFISSFDVCCSVVESGSFLKWLNLTAHCRCASFHTVIFFVAYFSFLACLDTFRCFRCRNFWVQRISDFARRNCWWLNCQTCPYRTCFRHRLLTSPWWLDWGLFHGQTFVGILAPMAFSRSKATRTVRDINFAEFVFNIDTFYEYWRPHSSLRLSLGYLWSLVEIFDQLQAAIVIVVFLQLVYRNEWVWLLLNDFRPQ